MYINDETEDFFYIEKNMIPLEELKRTANGRYLWSYEDKVGDYFLKLRVSFAELTDERTYLETDHIKVKRADNHTFDFIAHIDKHDFKLSELQLYRCKYKEKVKGLDFKGKIDQKKAFT